MKNEINSRRQSYRRQLKKQDRELYFKQVRQEFLTKEHGEYCQFTQQLLISNLKQNQQPQQVLNEIIRRILSPDYFNIMMRLYDLGLTSILVHYLQEQKCLAEVIQCINFLLQKKQMDFNKIFYMHGILEYFVRYISVPELTKYCIQGIYNYTNKSTDYCQAFLDSKNYKILIKEFINLGGLSQANQQQLKTEQYECLSTLLYTLQNLIKIVDSTLNFNTEKIDIFNFVVELMDKRLFLKLTIGIAYEVFHSVDSKLIDAIIPLFNELMTEASPDDKYLYNLFVTIFYLSPHSQINYQHYFKLAILSSKMQKPLIRTLKKLAEQPNSKHIVPTDEIWWQKLTNQANDQDYKKSILQTIHELQIQQEWVWRLYSANLQNTDNSTLSTVLIILNKKVKSNRLKKSDLNIYIDKYQVLTRVEALSEHSNIFISETASQLATDLLALRTHDQNL